jgi:hypothetical protein
LKQNKFRTINVIQLREVISGKGSYRITIKGLDGDDDVLESLSRCDSLKLGISIYPIDK